MSRRRFPARLLLAVGLAAGHLQPASAQDLGDPETVPTFEAIGIYWRTPGAGGPCSVRFRENPGQGPAGTWREGLDLWFDDRVGEIENAYVGPTWHRNEYRGSLVGLSPGTRYEIELAVDGGPAVTVVDTTWGAAFPEAASVTYLSAPCTVSVGGTRDAYAVYAMSGLTREIHAPNLEGHHCLVVAAPFVILRGLVLRGGHNGILIERGAHDVVVEDCDIADWGLAEDGTGGTGWGGECAGIYVFDRWTAPGSQPDAAGVSRVVIQRNRIHDPHWDTNNWCEYNADNLPWDPCHPLGPLGIEIVNPYGNNVLRWNEIWSDNGHWYADGIGGHDNYSYFGCPGRDSDVYGNWIGNVWDDAIEVEGGNANVRVWGNYVDQTMTGIACAATSAGPLYIWRNVIDRSDKYDAESLDTIAGSDSCGCMAEFWDGPRPEVNAGRFLKATTKTLEEGGIDYHWGGGRVYVLHNTVLQRSNDPLDDDWAWDPWPYEKIDQGVRFGLNTCLLSNFFVRNNLIQVVDRTWYAVGFPDAAAVAEMGFLPNDFDFDMLNGVMTLYADACATATTIEDNLVYEPHGFYSLHTQDYAPQWGDLHLPARGESGIFQLAAGTPGHDDGEPLPNFNSGQQTIGAGPDLGAHEAGAAPMRFGVSAGEFGTDAYKADAAAALALSPNPAGSAVRVAFTVPSGAPGSGGAVPVRFSIHDVRGRRVVGAAPASLPAGPHIMIWDGLDGAGRRAAAGIYFFRLQIGETIRTGKVALLR